MIVGIVVWVWRRAAPLALIAGGVWVGLLVSAEIDERAAARDAGCRQSGPVVERRRRETVTTWTFIGDGCLRDGIRVEIGG